MLLALAVAHSRGDVDHKTEDVTRGDVDLWLTGVLPYTHWTSNSGWGNTTVENEHSRVKSDGFLAKVQTDATQGSLETVGDAHLR